MRPVHSSGSSRNQLALLELIMDSPLRALGHRRLDIEMRNQVTTDRLSLGSL